MMGNGQMFGNWTFGFLVFTVMFITVTLKLGIETYYWTWVNHFVMWGSVIFYFAFALVYGATLWPFLQLQSIYAVFSHLLSSAQVWLGIIVIVVGCLFPDILRKVFWRHSRPTLAQRSQIYINKIALGDDRIALQPLARARNQLSKISYWRPAMASPAWNRFAVAQAEKQDVHLLEEY